MRCWCSAISLYSHWGLGLEGGFFAIFPVVWVVPITMAAAAIHYQPRLQIYVAAVYVIGLSVLAFGDGMMGLQMHGADMAQLAGLFSPQANMIRIVMILAAALILILVARQGRLLLERAVRETTLRVNLTRYLPRELAPILSDRTFDDLRAGQRISATLLFVDIRASSSFGESMDPTRLAIFISSFRRRVVKAAALHGGMIDKFTGDGALILFGVPTARPDDAARALACGRTLLELVERWNAKREFAQPLRIGIGIHMGEMFCGVVGDEDRLEFTVLGETVNTAARIEQATKSADCDCLASQEVVRAAGEDALWREVECEPLPGVTRKIVLMGPKSALSLSFLLARIVTQQQRRLGEGEDDGERHDAEHLEADPEVCRLRAPDDLVEGREREEEQRPAERQLAPAFLGELEHAVEHDLQQRFAEIESAQQDQAEQRIHDGRLQLDEHVVLQRQRQPAEHHHDDARHHRHDRQLAGSAHS